ncbi:MAG TPA: energy transducer TonB [Ferruginibacter sp.]|nr:energy transducer TonB [Ferruginibacter sp.]HMP21703.1 energy transducer TonB [Ferruginibacter sp.]
MNKLLVTIFASLLASLLHTHAQTITVQDSADATKQIVFNKVEVEASYPGGTAAWSNFLQKKLKSSTSSDNDAPAGLYRIIVRFIVDKTGAISYISPETKFGYGMEEEVIRVIKLSGQWTPAYQNGRPVNAYRRQPVSFIVTSDDFGIKTQEPNTLFANQDNVIKVWARKGKPDDIEISAPGCKILKVDSGIFTIHPNKAGYIVVEVINTKKDKTIGRAHFTVK